MWNAPLRIASPLLTLLAVAGCSFNSGPALAPAGGVVRYKGQPIKDIAVVFHAEKGMMASGITDAEGRFRLSTMQPGDGATLGEQKVTFAYKDPTENVNPPPSPIPLRYRVVETSGTTAVVEKKDNEFTFELKDK
jgi:hypothetical protein